MKLLLFTAVLSILVAASAADQVRDADGNPVLAGTRYHIRPVSRDLGGGVTFQSQTSQPPFDVVLTQSAADFGHPVAFYPSDNAQTVNTGVDINIEFQAVSIPSAESPVWRLAGLAGTSDPHSVITGGLRGNPGQNTLSNWFKIEQVDSSSYRLVYCPTVADAHRPLCSSLGINAANRGLVPSDTPLVVQFVRAAA